MCTNVCTSCDNVIHYVECVWVVHCCCQVLASCCTSTYGARHVIQGGLCILSIQYTIHNVLWLVNWITIIIHTLVTNGSITRTGYTWINYKMAWWLADVVLSCDVVKLSSVVYPGVVGFGCCKVTCRPVCTGIHYVLRILGGRSEQLTGFCVIVTYIDLSIRAVWGWYEVCWFDTQSECDLDCRDRCDACVGILLTHIPVVMKIVSLLIECCIL